MKCNCLLNIFHKQETRAGCFQAFKILGELKIACQPWAQSCQAKDIKYF